MLHGSVCFHLLSFRAVSWPSNYDIPSDRHSPSGNAGYYHQAYHRLCCVHANHLTLDAKPGG